MFSKAQNFGSLFLLVFYVRTAVLQSAEPTNGTGGGSSNISNGNKASVLCYGELGCFGRRDFYDLFKRPINLWPQSPEKINVSYYLYTMKNRYVPNLLRYNFKKEDILGTNFDPKKPTKFVIHGFGSSFDAMAWMGDIKDLMFALAGDKYNVFGVDWSQGADTIVYMQAVANTRVVGAATAHFIKKLVEYTGVNVEDIHLIGHSLGAHISGYAGERFEGRQIGRISGLDPAGPDFYEDIPNARLDRTDAKFVDAIHTDYGTGVLQGFGIWDTVGMDDFYPNSGYQQPGCGMSKGFFNVMSKGFTQGVGKTMACSHQRAWILFIVDPDSMDESCQYVGYECESWDKFIQGQCGDCGTEQGQEKCGVFSVFGPDDTKYGNIYSQHMNRMKTVDTKNRRLYFKTTEHSPFCLHHYQMVIHFADDMPQDATGTINLSLGGYRRKVDNFPFSEGVNTYKAGMNATDLGTWAKSLGQIQSIILEWKSGSYWSFWSKKVPIHVKKIEMNYMSNFDPKYRKMLSATLCPQSGPIIDSGASAIFGICESVTTTRN